MYRIQLFQVSRRQRQLSRQDGAGRAPHHGRHSGVGRASRCTYVQRVQLVHVSF
jgi:hypothetical protein